MINFLLLRTRAVPFLLRRASGLNCRRALSLTFIAVTAQAAADQPQKGGRSLEGLLQAEDLIVLADVKHGVRDRIAFFSSMGLFQAMARSGVRHVAIEMPRVLGRQAMSIETSADVEAFAQDVIRADRWHFMDPDHPDEESAETQRRVASALGRQVLFAKQLGINPIFYDFNNPLGGFTTYNDPVYRCLASFDTVAWLRYGLDGKVTKSQRDAAIMRERFSHDDELAAFIEQEVNARGGGKLVVIPGYAHAVMPGGVADRLGQRLNRDATIIAVFKDETEDKAFHNFLWQQSRLLSIDLSRSPNYYFTMATSVLRAEDAPGRYAALDSSRDVDSPPICHQIAHLN
jgi:hypothetical protein